MSEAVRLLLTAGCSGLVGILLCTLFAAVELHTARRHYNITNGPLPPDTQRAAWARTSRGIGIVGIAGMLCFVHTYGVGWPAIVFIVSFLAGAFLRVKQAHADLS